jgi:hypothetical protein
MILLALLGTPAPASAGQPRFPARPGLPLGRQLGRIAHETASPGRSHSHFSPSFRLKTKNGYVVEVYGAGETVAVAVIRFVADSRGQAGSETVYLAKGTATTGRLRASFGKFGELDMRFHQLSNRTWVRPHRVCHGAGRFVNRLGIYTGRFRFRGESGYVSVHAHRAKGAVRSVARHCEHRGPSPRRESRARLSHAESGGRESGLLSADWRDATSATRFVAFDGRQKTFYLASAQQGEGAVGILRLAEAKAPLRTFSVDDALTVAKVSPPAPFSGSGSYAAAPDGTKTWAGPLAVDFPGATDLPLTGPAFGVTVGTIPIGLFSIGG